MNIFFTLCTPIGFQLDSVEFCRHQIRNIRALHLFRLGFGCRLPGVLNTVDKVGAVRTESLTLGLRPLKDLPDTLLGLQSLQVVVAQVELVGSLAAGLALEIAALLDVGLIVLDDGLYLVLEGLLQQDVVPVHVQALVQAADEALERFVVFQVEERHLGVAGEVEISQSVDITQGLGWRRSHLVLGIVIVVHQTHMEELQLGH